MARDAIQRHNDWRGGMRNLDHDWDQFGSAGERVCVSNASFASGSFGQRIIMIIVAVIAVSALIQC